MTTTGTDHRQPRLTDQAARIDRETDPLARLGEIRLLRELLASAEAEAVNCARAKPISWAAIGAKLGISKQAAAKRFSIEPPTESSSAQKVSEQSHPPKAPPKKSGPRSWEVTTPRGRTLLRIRQSRES